MERLPDTYEVVLEPAQPFAVAVFERSLITTVLFAAGCHYFALGLSVPKIGGFAIGAVLANLAFVPRTGHSWLFDATRRAVSGQGDEVRFEDCAELLWLESGGQRTLYLVTRAGRHLRLSEAVAAEKPGDDLIERARIVAALTGARVVSRPGAQPDPRAIDFQGAAPSVTPSIPDTVAAVPSIPPTMPPPPVSTPSRADLPTIETPVAPPSGSGSVSTGRVSAGRSTPTGPVFSGIRLPNSEEFRSTYEPVRHLGRGAMGDVLLMKQLRLDRLVAVKFVRAETLSTAEAQRIEREAKILAKLSHPGILGIFDVRADESIPYMVCEYVDGETLADRLHRPPRLTVPEAVELGAALLDALDTAHRKGIVHRDLKPGNIFLTAEGKPKIGDFGLAKAQAIPSGGSVGKLIGTPAYMSPEQCRGASTTESSDLYALGVVLFEMVTGQRPYPGPELYQYLNQHTSSPVPDAKALRSEVPAALSQLLLRALAKQPAERPANAAQFRAELLASSWNRADRQQETGNS